MKKLIILVFSAMLFSCSNQSDMKFSLPSIIDSDMVLQRNTDVKLWGNAKPGSKISLSATWGATAETKADKSGKWQISIKTEDAGGPYDLTFTSKDTTLTLNNVLLGEVWLCSGQSNMEMPLAGWPPNDTIEGSAEAIASANYPDIRLFTVARVVSTKPLTDCRGDWEECTPENAKDFSATAYFFGRKLHKELNIPIGLIHSSWGGTPAEAWTDTSFLKQVPGYEHIADSLKETAVQNEELLEWMSQLDSREAGEDNLAFVDKVLENENQYAQKDFNDSAWSSMLVPSIWESSELPGFDGMVWFRTTFKVTADMLGKELELNLGPIDDMDATFINGQQIGATLETGFWNLPRQYTIPANLLEEGENVLAVCVIDNQGGGGIYGSEPITIKSSKGKEVNLNGNWKYLPVAEIRGDMVYFYNDEKTFSNRPPVEYTLNQYTPTALYNGMINPLIPFTIKGAIWYQGESNVGRGYQYRSLFPAMITNWRTNWGQGDFPFYYVQIAPYAYDDEPRSATAEVREAQFLTLNIPNTGMVVTTDIGNPVNIHPAEKQEVGERLARWALGINYGYEDLEYSGPLYESMTIEGNKIIVHFTHAEKGLKTRGGAPTHFEIAGEDQVYHPAKATIVGGTVEVWSAKVENPVAVRFGWSATAEPNLFNVNDLPASPFRTDDWKRLSQE